MSASDPRPNRPHRLAAAILAAVAGCGVASAQDNPELEALTRIRSFIEFGLGVVDEESYRFGRYRGLEREGGYGVLNIDWYRRAAHDAEQPDYVRVSATDLGLSTRRIELEQGRQGAYRVRAGYAQMPTARSDSSSTPFLGAGGNRLTLPDGWVGATSTAGMTALPGALQPVRIGHERRRYGLALDVLLARGWEISSDVRHERKEGLKTVGAVIGNSGGNPRAVILPEPIDYELREGEVTLRWFDPRKQFEARYLVSLFVENLDSLSWQNPFAAIGGWNAAAGFPTGFGQLALAPDNQFHQGSLSGGWNWDNGVRFSGTVALGRMTQDEEFLPYTINPAIAATITQALPRASLDGRIDTTTANLQLTGRGAGRFTWGASWRLDDRDNRTPRAEYVYIGGDSANQSTAANSSFRRFNEPLSYRDERLKLDAGFRLASRTRLTGSLERRATERTYSEREEADETSLKLALRHDNGAWLSAGLRFERADREGSTYVGNEPFLSGYAPGYTSTVAGQFENPPLLRKLHLADRRRARFAANASVTPAETWSVTFDVQRVDDDYRASALGVGGSESDVFTLDASWMPSTTWSSYAFLTREALTMDQAGVSTRGATRVADAEDPARRWTASHRDHIDTAGAGTKWKLAGDRIELALDYLHARADTDVDVLGGAAVPTGPLPTVTSRLRSLSMQADWRFDDDWSLRVRLWNERLRSGDFALDGIEPGQLANVVLLGEDSADYDVNVLFATLSYRF
jgi:MtrB/PioB family decaheme-associated outer membrane protein